MTKKHKPPPKRVVTKRQLSYWQRQRRIQRITLISGSLVIALVLAILGWGYYEKEYVPHQEELAKLRQTVAVAGDTTFDVEYFIETLRYRSLQSPDQPPSTLAPQALSLIENVYLIREEARERGLSIDKADVDKALENTKFKGNKVVREIVEASLLQPRLVQALGEEQIPATVPQVEVQAMLLDFADFLAARDRLEAGEDFAAVAQELSIDTFPISKRGQPLWFPLPPWQIARPAFDRALANLEPGELSLPIWDKEAPRIGGYWVIKAITKDEEAKAATVQAILTYSRHTAEVLRNWVEAGEDLGALAQEYSQHPTAQASGYITVTDQAETMSRDFVEACFALEPGELGPVIYDSEADTRGGAWLIKALRKEERPLDTVIPPEWFPYLNEAFNFFTEEIGLRRFWELRLFNDWLTQALEESPFQSHWDDLDPELRDWAITRASRDR
ncbi:MAG TPA: hypothetical protein G4O03_02955 [Dehalococcoidia bacterium]|nr:hypothetical protein [Dehalococcoidia bacterium]